MWALTSAELGDHGKLGAASNSAKGVHGCVYRIQTLREDLRQATTAKEVADIVVRHGMAAMDATAGALGVVYEDGRSLALLSRAGQGTRALSLTRVCPIETHAPLTFVARTGQSLWLSSAEDYEGHYPRMSRCVAAAPVACVPVRIGGLPKGALGFVLASGRQLSAAERAFVVALGSQCASALDRVRLRGVKIRATRSGESSATRLERVQRVTAALSRAPGVAEVAEVVAREGQGGLGAELCLVAEWDRGVSRLLAKAGDEGALDRAHQVLLKEWLPEVARLGATQDPVTLREIPGAPAGLVLACVPMLVEGRLLGALAFSLKRPRASREETQGFMVALGDLCGQALERARLYESERAARERAEAAAQRAEEAGRLKDTFLGIVSHELRTPLTAILGWANILRSRGDVQRETLLRALDSIARNAAQQARIVDELLDASQITRGGMELACEPLDLRSTLASVLEGHTQAAALRRIELRSSLPPRGDDEGLVSGDRMRLEGVFSHLISNAIKFTPPGGQVEVAMHILRDTVRVEVQDTGEGIEASHLPRLFDQFHQADTSITRRHGGLGLGLSIVRYVVEAHGGRVSAHSRGRGQGATLVVELPFRSEGVRTTGDPDTEIRLRREKHPAGHPDDAKMNPTRAAAG
jgi:hypothetical protein